MAQALRTDWLVQEEVQETAAPPVRSPWRRSPQVNLALVLGSLTLLVTLGVSILVAYVRTHAQIAEYEILRDRLTQRSAQLDTECVELNLALERMATETRLARVAQEKQLGLPDPSRLSYLPGAEDYPGAVAATSAPSQPTVAHTPGRRLIARLSTAWQTFGGDTAQARVHD